MKNIIKKILAIWISIYLIVIPPFAHAASAGGWSFSAFDVATSIVTALKGGASASVAVAKSPITSKIAKGIVGGAIVGAALPLAISQVTGIALTALDWVLDPANNTIKYKDKTAPDVITGTKYHFYQDYDNLKLYDTPQAACNITDLVAYYPNMAGFAPRGVVWTGTKCVLDPSGFNWEGYRIEPVVVNIPNDYKTIPIPTVADKIYDNAKTDSNSRSIVNDAVKDYVNSGAADTALDAAKADADTTHNCGTGTHWSGSACVADTPTDTPFDPTDIIDAIGKVFDAVMSLPDVINSALDDLLADIKDFFQPFIDLVTDFFDWLKDTATDWKNNVVTEYQDVKQKVIDAYDEFIRPNNEPTDVDLDVPQTQNIDTDINFGGSCPANVTGSFVIGGRTTTFNIMDFSQFCLIMSTYLKPLVIALASYQAVKILAGRNESN